MFKQKEKVPIEQSQYTFFGTNEIIRLSKYCKFPLNEHEHPFTFFMNTPLSAVNDIALEQLIFMAYKFYNVYTDQLRTSTVIPGFVDLIKNQNVEIIRHPFQYMAPFLPEYTHLAARLQPPPYHPFFSTKVKFITRIVKLAVNKDFRERFTSFMGIRATTTCPKCCLYLIILMLKCSFMYYYYRYFALNSECVLHISPFDVNTTQVLLGCKPGIDDWKRRHAFIHKTYLLMINTPDFVLTIETIIVQLIDRLYLSIDDIFYTQFTSEFWANVPNTIGLKNSPSQAVIRFMIEKNLWKKEDVDKNKKLYKLAIYLMFQRALYNEKTYRKSVYHSWVDTNMSHSAFLVIFDKDNFPSVVFVRYTKYMVSDIHKNYTN